MKLLELIFHFGVLFAVYNFIWFFIDLSLSLLRAGTPRSLADVYLFKTIKYIFLVNVTFLSVPEFEGTEPVYQVPMLKLIPALIILLTYVLGKFQQKQQQAVFFGAGMGFQNRVTAPFDARLEWALIGLTILEFAFFAWYPYYAENSVSRWFYQTIQEFEHAFFLGFIFNVIGFFFLMGMFTKLLNAINFLISGRPLVEFKQMRSKRSQSSDQGFDDFEEIDDQQLNH
ncbi:MAG: hypothetical protein RLZZ301_52 [Bacteroidota bacterium]|jgi:hypothetical protein